MHILGQNSQQKHQQIFWLSAISTGINKKKIMNSLIACCLKKNVLLFSRQLLLWLMINPNYMHTWHLFLTLSHSLGLPCRCTQSRPAASPPTRLVPWASCNAWSTLWRMKVLERCSRESDLMSWGWRLAEPSTFALILRPKVDSTLLGKFFIIVFNIE